MTKRLLIIPARSGSKRIKNKNIRLFQKKPIIYFPLEEARKSKLFEKIHVSTDSKKIKKIVESLNFKVDFLRPKKLAGDKVSTEKVLRYVVREYEKMNLYFEEIWSITPCSPLINKSDLIKAAKKLYRYKKKIILSVSKYSVPIDWAFKKKKDFLIPLIKDSYKKRSQDILDMYHDSGNFVGIPISFFKCKKINFDKNYIAYELPKKRSVDIDTFEDFQLAEILYVGSKNI